MQSDPPRDERRREYRAPIELRVEYKKLNSFFADYAKNISRGGTFIATDRPLEIGTELMFRLLVPTLPAPLEIRGRVQWISDGTGGDEKGMGINFIYASEVERMRVEAIVDKLLTETLGPRIAQKVRKGST